MGENQHFLPQWLLRRFASRRRGKRTFVEVHTKSTIEEKDIEVVGSEQDFYEIPDLPRRTVEDDLATLDGVHADIVRRGASKGLLDPKIVGFLPRLFADLSLRTRNTRRGFQQSTDETSKRSLDFALTYPVDELIENVLQTAREREPGLVESLDGLGTPEALKDLLKANAMPDARRWFAELVTEYRLRELPEAIRSEHVRSLRAAIRVRASKVYGNLRWNYVPVADAGLVLGDCALVTYSLLEDRYLPSIELPLAGHGARLHILPVGPSGAIVGAPTEVPHPELDAVVAGLNRASASLSEEYFVAPDRTHADLCIQVGSEQALWRSFPDPD
jgi:hypothetical protein